jgi:FkbM family methyltransferase
MLSMLDKAILGAVRRTLPTIPSIYLPGLGQSISFLPDVPSSYQEIFVRQVYRTVAPIPKNAVVLDLGAYIGLFSIYISKLCPAARVTTVEANPQTIPILTANLQQSTDHGSKIAVIHGAICDHGGSISMTVHAKLAAHIGATAYRNIDSWPDHSEFTEVTVPAIPLASLLQEPVDFMKCDIEGAEYAALSSVDFSPKLIRQAAIEFHDIDTRTDEFKSFLTKAISAGYNIYTGDREPILDLSRFMPPGNAVVVQFVSADLL